jgi:hypothetical protein
MSALKKPDTLSDYLCLFSPLCVMVNAGGSVALTSATRSYGPRSPLKSGALLLAAVAVVAISARYAQDYQPDLS